MARRKAPENGSEVLGGIVIGDAQAHAAFEFFPVQRPLRFTVQIQNAPGVAQQALALWRDLLAAAVALQQAMADCRLKLFELHADGGLGAVHLARRARQRSGVDHCDKALEPIHLKVLRGCWHRVSINE